MIGFALIAIGFLCFLLFGALINLQREMKLSRDSNVELISTIQKMIEHQTEINSDLMRSIRRG